MTKRNTRPIHFFSQLLAIPALSFAAAGTPVLAHEDDEVAAGHTSNVLHLATEHEVTLGAGMTMVLQGMNDKDSTTDDSGMSYSVDLAFEGHLGELGTAFVYINTAQGAGISPNAELGPNADNETGDIAVTGAGFSDTRVAEVWMQFNLGAAATLTVGKIDPTGIYDANAIANDETTQFLADAFVNNPAIGFPGYVGGLSLGLMPTENTSVNLGVFETGGDFNGGLDRSFAIAEAGLATHWAGRPGNLRLIAWQDDETKNEGTALSVDQQITDQLTLMLRWGTQEDNPAVANNFDGAVTAGGQWVISPVATAGFAVGQLAATPLGGANDERWSELYYSHALSDHVHVTADVQMISNPGFSSANDNITVYGLRAQVDL